MFQNVFINSCLWVSLGINSYSHDVEKVRRRRPCNMQPVRNPPIERMSTLSIRLSLQQMCVQFLQCCYNPIMKLTKVLWVSIFIVCVLKALGQFDEGESNGT